MEVVDGRGKRGHATFQSQFLTPLSPTPLKVSNFLPFSEPRTRAPPRFRGNPTEQLPEHGDFLETCYLLLYGELPTAAQRADFVYRVTRHTMVHEQMSRFFQGFRRDAHPMAVMRGSGGGLSAFYPDSPDLPAPHHRT